MEKTKSEIRREILKMRKSLTLSEVTSLSRNISKHLLETEHYKNAHEILIYSSYNNEVLTEFIARNAFDNGKKVYFPKTLGEYMEFYRVNDFNELFPGTMGILEPIPDENKIYNDSYNSIIIMPLSVYDITGNRIGYGGGYYDKFLASHVVGTKIGIAYSFQEYKYVPSEPTDIKMDYIINENEVLKTQND